MVNQAQVSAIDNEAHHETIKFEEVVTNGV